MKIIIITLFLLPFLLCRSVHAQMLVVDPTTSVSIAINSSVINGQLNKTNDNLSAIQRGQLLVTSQLVIVNDLQKKIHTGLSEVASIINNLNAIKEIASCGTDIVKDVGQAISIARSNPVLLLFAEEGAREFKTHAVSLSAEVSAFVLKGGTNLMDAGERGRLLNHIQSEMQILRGIAYGMGRAMYWAQMRGIWASLNPWAEWQNMDVRIANEVLTNAKYLKQ